MSGGQVIVAGACLGLLFYLAAVVLIGKVCGLNDDRHGLADYRWPYDDEEVDW